MSTIRSLLAREPEREIVGVIKVDDHDPARVWTELDEYVATEEIKGYFRTFVDRFIESRRGLGEDLCVWISGFFGSGKSHFLKALGYLLENRLLAGPGGTQVLSTEFLGEKFGLGSLVPLLTREFKTKALYVNLLDRDPARPAISRVIYRQLLKEKGLSTDFWVAAWEEELAAVGKWEEFREWVRNQYGRSWEEERRLNADAVLTRALVHLLPDRYPEEVAARRALDDSKARFAEILPETIAVRLRQEAEELDPQRGRLVVLLDEVGLYIGESQERVTDLNRLAEKVVQEGRGKVWLVATAQETLEELVPKLGVEQQVLAWLQDRFRLRFKLTPGNIEEVVAERLLKKSPQGTRVLREVYERLAGQLSAGAVLQGVAGGRLDPRLTWERFVRFYPLMPYAIILLQEAFSTLRQRSWGNEEVRRRLGGRERSMLQTVHAVLRGEGPLAAFAERPVGSLVTFDLLYDAISSELSIIQSAHHHAITNRLRSLDVGEGLPAPQVAKALFLLQQVGEWLPTTVENVAAVLYLNIEGNVTAHREAVKRTLETLKAEGWVVEEQGRYRFLSPVEHDFEQEVWQHRPSPAAKKEAAVGLVRELLERFRYEHGERARTPQNVTLTADGQVIRETGELKVRLYSPLSGKEKQDVLAESVADPDTLFCLAREAPEFERMLERTLAIEKALDALHGRPLAGDQERYKQEIRREAEDNRSRRLPELLERAFLGGTFYLGGAESEPNGSSLASALENALKRIAANVFTEFIDVRVEREEDCAKILTWRPGAPLPQVYQDLGLVGAHGINAACRAASQVLGELRRRQGEGLEMTGGALAAHFEKKPYGWSHQLLRLILATLFKNGSVSVEVDNQELTDPAHPRVRQIFESYRNFRHAVFKVLPAVDWRRARELYIGISGNPVGETFEEVSDRIRELATAWSSEAARLADRARDLGLPQEVAEGCRMVAEVLAEIARLDDPNARLRRFLEKEGLLREKVPLFRKLKEFEPHFDGYRGLREFIRETAGWARDLSGELRARWQSLEQGLLSEDFWERYNELSAIAAVLRRAYQEDYDRRHAEVNRTAVEAVEELRRHPAFGDTGTGDFLQSVEGFNCPGEPLAAEALLCSRCRRRYEELTPAQVILVKGRLLAALDRLLAEKTSGDLKPGPVEPFVKEAAVSQPGDLDALLEAAKSYIRENLRRQQRFKVKITVTPEEQGR